MSKVVEILALMMLVTILHGFPEKHFQKNQNDKIPIRENKRQDPLLRNRDQPRRIRDVETESAESSEISTIPAEVDLYEKDTSTTEQQDNEEKKPLNRSQLSTLPAAIDFSDDTETESSTNDSSEESQSKVIRSAERDNSSSEENSRENIKPANNIKYQPNRHNNQESSEEDRK